MASLASVRILWPLDHKRLVGLLIGLLILAATALAQPPDIPGPLTATISGTVTDADGAIVPGATVNLIEPGDAAPRTLVADSNAAFDFSNLKAGGPYLVTIKANGFVPWTSAAVTLNPGQVLFLSAINMRISGGATSVTVYGSQEQLATEQVRIAEKQRVLGIVPNFYVVYDHNPAPLTPKLKFSLAYKSATDPVVFLGSALVSGMDQAGSTPDYQQGARGYGQRLAENYATGFTNIMIGGAILPTLLRQDPRYFYQGTGSTRARVLHALSSPFIARGDNGRWQPNYSSVGGDLAAGAISQTYLPASNRGAAMVFQTALITTAGRMANGVIQEFLLRRFTPGAAGEQ